jgi:cytochrome P450
MFSFAYAEVFCMLSVVLRKFRLVLADPEDKPRKVWGLLVHPDREIWIRLERR